MSAGVANFWFWCALLFVVLCLGMAIDMFLSGNYGVAFFNMFSVAVNAAAAITTSLRYHRGLKRG